jgi:hypothetical protein
MFIKKYRLIKRFYAWFFVAVLLATPLANLIGVSSVHAAATPAFPYGTLYYVSDPSIGDLEICNNPNGLGGNNAICWLGTSSEFYA